MSEPRDTTRDDDAAPAPKNAIARFAPIAVIVAAAAIIIGTGAHRYLSLETLRENYQTLESFVATRFWLALGLFALGYIAVAALSLPGASLMSILGGFLFGIWVGTGVVVVAATIGATIVFTAARTAFGESLKSRAGGFIHRMEDGFNKNAFSYLLLLRLLPIFPFFIVNVAPAFFNVSTRAFFLATLIGIIPGAFAYVSAGNGLGAVLEAGEDLNLSGLLLKPEILTPIVALSVLALIPIVARALGVNAGGDAENKKDAS